MQCHIYDKQRIYVTTVAVDPYGPIPLMSVAVAPPETTGSEVAQWRGCAWVVLQKYPPLPSSLLDEAREAAVQALSRTTERLIKSVANSDTQASLALLFPSMSGPDFDRAVTYFDWHKKMLAKHYEIKNQLVASTTLDALQAVVGDEFAGQYAELMSAAPHDSVNLSSYTD